MDSKDKISDPGGIVTSEDLRTMLDAPSEATLVVEEGQARVVTDAAAADAMPILDQGDLTTMLDGARTPQDQTLDQLAAGLDSAVRQQGG